MAWLTRKKCRRSGRRSRWTWSSTSRSELIVQDELWTSCAVSSRASSPSRTKWSSRSGSPISAIWLTSIVSSRIFSSEAVRPLRLNPDWSLHFPQEIQKKVLINVWNNFSFFSIKIYYPQTLEKYWFMDILIKYTNLIFKTILPLVYRKVFWL